ncbi:hypothetical protein tb265_44180 [Gemmatimonadetes bacterium T265]|nr:hypothetical protein tb265_44180 [Gemmatimonadetes bacterium T265]
MDGGGMSDDATIVRRVLAGDGEAFGVLVDRHYDRCLRLAVHLLGDRADAEDAVQEALLRAYRHLGRYREEDRFAAWLTRILVNQCRTTRARRPGPVPADLDWGTEDGLTEHPADGAALRDELAYVLRALPADQREAVVLRYADDLTYDEMARATGATVGALKMRVRRACDRLRALLSGAGPAGAGSAGAAAPARSAPARSQVSDD